MKLKLLFGNIYNKTIQKSQKSKKSLIIIAFICIGNFTVIYIKQNFKYKNYDFCRSYDDDLPSAEDIIGAEDSIFYHETSPKGDLSIRQACCVESCARMNSKSQINVIFSSPTTNKSKLKLLCQFENIKFFRVDIASYVKGTPMEDFDTGILIKSAWPNEVTSDALRYLTLYKWGGIYLDLDIMVVRPLMFLGKNWAAQENCIQIGSAALSFARDELGRYVARKSVIDFIENFNLTIYSHNGPGVISRVLQDLCEKSPAEPKCRGFKIYGNITFTPITYENAYLYFLAYKVTSYNSREIFGYHMFNFASKSFKIEKNSFYAYLAKRFCPKIYKEFIHEFSH